MHRAPHLLGFCLTELWSRNGIHFQGVKEMETQETLSRVWDQHVGAEFAAHNADQAVATMTAEAYVNYVPLMIGVTGRNAVRDYYANHFGYRPHTLLRRSGRKRLTWDRM